MKNKLLIFSALIISAFIFSSCTLNIQNKNSTAIPTSTQINEETGDDTEDELLNQLNADTDSSFDSDLNSLEAELDK